MTETEKNCLLFATLKLRNLRFPREVSEIFTGKDPVYDALEALELLNVLISSRENLK